jgi:hypothetical protein
MRVFSQQSAKGGRTPVNNCLSRKDNADEIHFKKKKICVQSRNLPVGQSRFGANFSKLYVKA